MAKHTIKDLADLAVLLNKQPSEAAETQDHNQQETQDARALQLAKLVIQFEKKGRKGKGVTTIKGFFHTTKDLELFARELKTRCGSGGTVKNDTIEIQGDHRDAVVAYFRSKGFRGNF